jgi:hypothetical protein
MIKLNREELAWAAGFFDGEGSTSLRQIKGGYSGLTLDIGQKDREVLDRFQAAVGGLGKVYFNPSRPASPYSFTTGRFETIQAILAMLWPFLGTLKRAQAFRALTTYWSKSRQSPAQRKEWGKRQRDRGARAAVNLQPAEETA